VRRQLKKYLWALLTLTGFLNAHAEQTTSVEEKLQSYLSELNTLQTRFTQQVFENRRLIQKASGTFLLKRPGMFRWHTQTPTNQLIISNGKTIWIYEEDLEQVTIKQLSNEIQGTPALFLSGYNKQITSSYDVSLKQLKHVSTFHLTPKKTQQNSQYVWIELSYSNRKLSAVSLLDKLGQTTILRFSNSKINQKLSDKVFKFTPPKGVDVITQ
jgi:outer membrane lipoprotein carrier protein